MSDKNVESFKGFSFRSTYSESITFFPLNIYQDLLQYYGMLSGVTCCVIGYIIMLQIHNTINLLAGLR